MMNFFMISLGIFCLVLMGNLSALALPPREDIPEEILSTEIIVEGKSPIDNKSLTAADYALLEEKIANSAFPPVVNSDLRHQIFLLNILKMIRTISPFNN
ncbi:hypothetical protein [Geminocystis sp.]|uniref:hypothetical protein n=1 Tax=Geminocystis sp. TaxID=2664100 RepID=UPI003593C208